MKVVCLHPNTVYWIEILKLICCKIGNACLKKTEMKRIRGRDGTFKKKICNPRLSRSFKTDPIWASVCSQIFLPNRIGQKIKLK